MAFEELTQLGRVSAKANLLAERYAALQESRDQAVARANELEEQLDACRKRLQTIELENEYLRTAAVITPDRDQIEKTRAIVVGLMREIDRCITDLESE